MISHKFEIKVALLGYVSVGKTTILNAMFRDKFSEVSMRRTTAGINFFRIVTKEDQLSENGDTEEANKTSTAVGTQSDQWSVIQDEECQKAEAVLKEIEASNKELRKANKIEEQSFNIELDENLCKMRKDTSLVVVDIPGVNEADTDSIYMDYAEDNWDSFDCVVVVMDARQGVNTEEQVRLLKFVKENLTKKKNLPVVILCNKVDDPDDMEQAVLVTEARQKVAEIFQVGCREEALQKALVSTTLNPGLSAFPVFIATSAVHAFFYRSASLLTFEQFKQKFDKDLIDKIGREEVGRFSWKKLSDDEKYHAVFKSVQDDSKYVERLEATNFDKFLNILASTLGGTDTQIELLRKQVDVDMKSLSSGNCTESKLRSIYDKCLVLQKDMATMKQSFWCVYNDCKITALTAFEESLEGVEVLADPLKLLMEYAAFIRLVGWKEEEVLLKAKAEELFRLQLGVVLSELDSAKYHWADIQGKLCSPCINLQGMKISPKLQSPFDWLSIIESVKLASNNDTFCETFGREKVMLSKITFKVLKSAAPLDTSGCPCRTCQPYLYSYISQIYTNCASCGSKMLQQNCKRNVNENKWDVGYEFAKQTRYEFNKFTEEGSRIKVPASLSDEKHWGHVAWSVCKLLRSLNV